MAISALTIEDGWIKLEEEMSKEELAINKRKISDQSITKLFLSLPLSDTELFPNFYYRLSLD